MNPMGALQPGIPSPTTVPQNWHIIITDLQDCFLNIPLHPFTPFDFPGGSDSKVSVYNT